MGTNIQVPPNQDATSVFSDGMTSVWNHDGIPILIVYLHVEHSAQASHAVAGQCRDYPITGTHPSAVTNCGSKIPLAGIVRSKATRVLPSVPMHGRPTEGTALLSIPPMPLARVMTNVAMHPPE